MKNLKASEIIDIFRLKPLIKEGGFYREAYISEQSILVFNGPDEEPLRRKASTSIYYLITKESFSSLHRLRFDETFHFYGGGSARMIQIEQGGSLREVILGDNVKKGEVLQTTVSSGIWQGMRLFKGSWALFGTQVAPGFDFDDFELGSMEFLTNKFPQHKDIISEFTAK